MANETLEFELFRTSNHPCSFLENRSAATLFLDPAIKISKRILTTLSKQGVRRSGELLYKPDCESCNACISCRIPIMDFKLRKSYQRILKLNQALEVTVSKEQYNSFILKSTDNTVFFKSYDNKRLVAVSVIDIHSDGLSAIYSFYDPFERKRSLGTYSILYLTSYAADN